MIRVLSVPPRHPYVDRLHGTAARLVHRDEPWPRLEAFYDPDWVAANADGWDVVHWHFTWEQHPIERLAAVLDRHHDAGTPVVWTVHDLRNPHTPDGAADAAYLEVLAARADAVLTLTPTAAREVRRRFGRTAEVVPHGPLLADGPAARPRCPPPRPTTPTVLLHARSLRRNLDLDAPVAAARTVAAEGRALRLRLSLHDEPAVVARFGRGRGRDPGVERWYHPPLAHDALVDEVARADALLLPYRWGTHSGLLELAADVGTAVIAADVGALRDQGPGWLVPVDRDGLDVEVLAAALRDVAAGHLRATPSPTARRAARRQLVAAHRRLYARLAAARR